MKRALVTGASTGIGLLFAQTLKNEGWDITGVARSEERLKNELGEGNYLTLDLSTEAGIKGIEDHLATTRYDLLINNAGFGMYGKFLNLPIEEQTKMIRLNVTALVRLSYAYLSKAVKGDALMNISSALALLPMPGAATYSGTKAFVTAFSECLWYEYKDRGIYIFASSPGAVETPFHHNAGGSSDQMDPKMMLSPELVVREALSTLKKRQRPSYVNGSKYRLITQITQLFPRSFRLKQMANNSQGMK